MLFSSRLMSFSSNHLTGLRSHHVVCIRTDNSYEAMDWIEIKNEGEVVVPEGQRWTEDLARRVLEGWWVGEHTGQSATKASWPLFLAWKNVGILTRQLDSLSPPRSRTRNRAANFASGSICLP